MKRLYLLLTAMLSLTACTVTVVFDELEVTASKTLVGPGETVTVTAKPNFETSSRILWSTGSKDTREPGVAFSNEGVGREVTYTAPQTPGTYTVIARSADQVSISDSVKITVDEFLGLDPLDAGTDLNATVAAGSIAPGDEKLFLVNVSSSTAAAGSALYLELDVDLDLTVLDDERSIYATSSSADYFAAGTAGLSRAGLAPQDIGVNRKCRGSCVIQDASAGNQYLRVENTSGDTVNYMLYAYVVDYSDNNEPENNSAATAVTLGDFDTGAIESIGDEDYYVAGKAGTLVFAATSWENVRVDITIDGNVVTLQPGDSQTRVFSGDEIRVYVSDGDRAAAVSASKYILELQ